MAVQIIWTKTAARQRRKILTYWKERNKSSEYPNKLVSEISERVRFLVNNPETYIKTEFPDIRASTLGLYNIIYKITSSELIIVAFWDNRRDPKRLSKILQK